MKKEKVLIVVGYNNGDGEISEERFLLDNNIAKILFLNKGENIIRKLLNGLNKKLIEVFYVYDDFDSLKKYSNKNIKIVQIIF